MRAAGALKLPVMLANPFATHRMPSRARVPAAPAVHREGWFHLADQMVPIPDRQARRRTQTASSGSPLPKVGAARQPGYRWQATRLIISHEKPIFKLVRNPYNRAVSSFLATLSHTRENEANPWGRNPVAAARKLAGKPAAPEPALSFRDFVGYLAERGTERWNMNGHVARQHVARRRRPHRPDHQA